MIGFERAKRTLKWFEGYLRDKGEGFSIEKNEGEKSYILYFRSCHIIDDPNTNYERINIAKFYRDKENVDIYSYYNGKDFDLFVKGLSMLKYWIDSASPEERFADEIKSAYKHNNFKTEFGEGLYLNLVKPTDIHEGYCCLTTIGDRYDWRQKYFTDKEIDECKKEYGINLSEYEKIEEGTYVD